MLTFYGSQDDSGVVVRYDVSVAVFGLVDLQVRVLPGELLTRIDGLRRSSKHTNRHINVCGGIFSSVFEDNGKRVLCNVDKLQEQTAVLNKS